MRRVRPLEALLTVWGLALVAGGVGCGGKPAAKAPPPPREVEAVTMAPAETRDTGEYLGTLTSRQSVNVVPQVAGYVRRIHVSPGQKVEAGTPLLEVDGRQESAALESAQAQRSSAQAALELAKQTRERTEALYKEGLVSAQELERARSQTETSEAAARVASAQVSQREVQLQYYVVRAPFAGTVGDVLVRLGDYVGAITPLTSVAQADALEVSVAVPSERARSLQPNTPIELLDAQGKVLLASTLFFVAPQADPRTQLVELKAAFRNTGGLRPNELVRARVIYSTRSALQVPALAVVRQSGQPFAFVVLEKEGKTVVERRPIKLGALGELTYVVESGLRAGERIAVSSLQLLRDGAPVKVKEKPAPTPTPVVGTGAGTEGGGSTGGAR
ncbi:efflux RND transporter periplasmic adaptor subunit [Hyalangium sp.]|uniref:efflux RND transporter periplasmic adaptor subunit n=1 Tax=Hyalangium sp. TaxID=2028555 RepID=UPI002D435E14|nr:efflux RND transporter periplasmic adaptor subunit [Hyalangium sp.]HYI02742.1 efflux RND transporter periplasmic adaptor subunit [Hyalangium sp.]